MKISLSFMSCSTHDVSQVRYKLFCRIDFEIGFPRPYISRTIPPQPDSAVPRLIIHMIWNRSLGNTNLYATKKSTSQFCCFVIEV